MEIAFKYLSPRIGCGLMLTNLPRFSASDPLNAIMSNYGYDKIFADKSAQKIITNTGLLRNFYDNAFSNKASLFQNFRSVFGNQEVYLVTDPTIKTVWFIADPTNKIALNNYFRDAVSLGLKADGILLLGSIPKLTPAGWQNLYDLMNEGFFQKSRGIERVEIMSLITGVRWRAPTLGMGVTFLNLHNLEEIKTTITEALRGGANDKIHR